MGYKNGKCRNLALLVLSVYRFCNFFLLIVNKSIDKKEIFILFFFSLNSLFMNITVCRFFSDCISGRFFSGNDGTLVRTEISGQICPCL